MWIVASDLVKYVGKGGKSLGQIYNQISHNPGFHELQTFLGRSPWSVFGFFSGDSWFAGINWYFKLPSLYHACTAWVVGQHPVFALLVCLWTTSLGSMCWCSSHYIARKLFYFHLNGISCISICAHYLLPFLSLGTPEKSLALASFLAISSVYTIWWDHLELHLLQVEQSQLSHILLLCQIHQSLNHPH